MSRQIPRRAVQLAVSAALATLIAACSADLTAPAPSRVASAPQHSATHDDIVGDTTLCRSGYQVVNGRYVCNPQ